MFFDVETRSAADLKNHGHVRYAHDPTTELLLMCFVHEGKEYTWENPRYGGHPQNEEAVKVWNEYTGYVIAWNAKFDRAILEHVHSPFTAPTIERTIDAMAQAENFGLPGGLDHAAKILELPEGKLQGGKALIAEFCNANNPWLPTPEKIEAFREYCMQDVRVLKAVWDRCRPWVASEWEDYHVVSRMNARGVQIDVELVQAGARLGASTVADANKQLRELTGDPKMSASKPAAKLAWLREKLDGHPLEKVLKDKSKKSGYSTSKNHLKDLRNAGAIADDLPDRWDEICAFIDLLEDAGGPSAKKFAKMEKLHYGGRLYDQYVCSPAITGRHASRGVQLDNILRATVDDPEYAIAALKSGRFQEVAAELGMSENKLLERLIRPAIISPDGLTWGDWSSIEARMLAWLAGEEDYLDVFRRGGDIYVRTAAGIYGVPESEVDKKRRFVGKVATLALGYRGGAGALLSMARNYGAPMDVGFAERVKVAFRQSNPWLVAFWDALEEAMEEAMRNPGARIPVGRVKYICIGSNLHCVLPCGRLITYPEMEWEHYRHKGWQKPHMSWRYRKRLSSGVARSGLYSGILAENITQGAAASLLRDLMKRLDRAGLPLVASRHDEVLLEGYHCEQLEEAMLYLPTWAEGLPLAADVASGERYGK